MKKIFTKIQALENRAAAHTPAPVTPQVVDEVKHAWKEIHEGVKKLWTLYEKYEDLNNVQPASTSKVTPASIDEWWHQISGHIEDWEHVKNKLK